MDRNVRVRVGGFLTAALCLLGVQLCAAGGASAATFPANAATLGAIPDGTSSSTAESYGAPLNITFTVTGEPLGTPSNVAVSLTGSHTWVADLEVVLIAPNGAQQTIFNRTGAIGASNDPGDSSNLGGPYSFWDGAPSSPTWWSAAAAASSTAPVPSGIYRASVRGGSSSGGGNALITPSFGSVDDPNGVWTLRIRDGVAADTGSITAARLLLGPLRMLTVSRPTGSGTGTITASGIDPIDCGVASTSHDDCTALVPDGDIITLTATPGAHSRFGAWSGACDTNATNVCSVTMNANGAVGASFALIQRTLTVSRPTGNGTGRITAPGTDGIDCGPAGTNPAHDDCTATVTDGDTITLTATPGSHSSFDTWSGDCDGEATATCALTMDADKTAGASFTLIQRTLTLTPGGTGSGYVDSSPARIDCGHNTSGHATCSANYTDGTDVTLTGHPSAGSAFAGFSGDSCAPISGEPDKCIATMDAAKNIIATFTDSAAPDVSITSGPNGPARDQRPTFAFTAEAGSTVVCSIDTGTASFGPCTDAASHRPASNLADGSYTFRVKATDGASNSATATRSFSVDATAPETTVSGPTGTIEVAEASFDLSATEASSYECRLDDGPFAACTSPKAYTGLSEGSHTFRARATDALGNVDQTPAEATFTVDLADPSPPTPGAPAVPETTIGKFPKNPKADHTHFRFRSSIAGSSFTCQLDREDPEPCRSPQDYRGLEVGRHRFKVFATSPGGEVDPTPAKARFRISG